MRIFKGLENIHSVIDKHQAEWLREQGEEPERPERISVEERIRRSFSEGTGSGKFSADRFMSGLVHEETETPREETIQNEPSVEIVNVIPQKDENHSWLYNEVVKAIHDAIGDGKNTKVVAVFVPVVQNVKEFESLPVDETVTINQPAHEEAVEPERETPEIESESEPELEQETQQEPESGHEPEMLSVSEEFNLIPEGQNEPDAELAGAFQTIEEKLDDSLHENESEHEPDIEQEEAFDSVIDEPDESDDVMAVSEGEPLAFSEIDEIGEAEEIELPEPLEDDEVVFDDSVFEDSSNLTEEHDESDEDSDNETITIEYKEEESPEENEKKED